MSAARRLKHRIDEGMNSYDAFIEVQTHLMSMAQAYIERVTLENYIQGVEECEDKDCQEILEKLCALYGLSTIEKHLSFYLTHDYLSDTKANAIRFQVDRLCLLVRKQALPLIQSFGIPDTLLAAPIAINYGGKYEE